MILPAAESRTEPNKREYVYEGQGIRQTDMQQMQDCPQKRGHQSDL